MRKRKQPPQGTADATDRLSIRIDLASGARIGPGKVAVLEEIGRAGSISAAGRALRMSYRRTWALVEDLNTSIGTAVVETSAGGTGGGGACLTPAGEAIIACYRAIETETAQMARKHLLALGRACAARPEQRSTRRHAQCAVEANDLAVEHGVLANMPNQPGEL
jgi:molybdate transport system regulatory protein